MHVVMFYVFAESSGMLNKLKSHIHILYAKLDLGMLAKTTTFLLKHQNNINQVGLGLFVVSFLSISYKVFFCKLPITNRKPKSTFSPTFQNTKANLNVHQETLHFKLATLSPKQTNLRPTKSGFQSTVQTNNQTH